MKINIKLIAVLALLLWLPSMLFAQRKAVSAKQQTQMVEEIEKAAAAVTSLQCDFVQTKSLSMLSDKLVSKGKMYYADGKNLRWEYLTPYTYTFILSGTKVLMKDAKHSNVIDVKSSKLFQEITRIMLNSVTGKCLSEKSEFKVKMFTEGAHYIAELTPQKKEMKQMFSTITLHYSTAQKLVTEVEMKEKTGDTTVIDLTNSKKNGKISAQLFTLH